MSTRNCLTVFLIVFFLCIIGIAIVGVLFFRLPEKWGWWPSPAAEMLAGTPHREGAAELMGVLEEKGMDTEGVEMYVLPIKDAGENLAVAVLDAAEGFDFSKIGTEGDPLTETMINIVTGPEAKALNIGRAVVEYRNEDGDTLFTFTAPSKDIRDFGNKIINREAFMEALDGDIDFSKLLTDDMFKEYIMF